MSLLCLLRVLLGLYCFYYGFYYDFTVFMMSFIRIILYLLWVLLCFYCIYYGFYYVFIASTYLGYIAYNDH